MILYYALYPCSRLDAIELRYCPSLLSNRLSGVNRIKQWPMSREQEGIVSFASSALRRKVLSVPLFLFETRLQKTKRNLQGIKSVIEQVGYIYVCYVSHQQQLMVVRKAHQNTLCLLFIKEFNENQKTVQFICNLSAFLKPEVKQNFETKSWSISDKMIVEDETQKIGLALAEFKFAEHNLRSYIQELEARQERLSSHHYKPLMQDLVENLCRYHLSSLVVGHISPEVILRENGRWFILCGDDSDHYGTDSARKINQPVHNSLPSYVELRELRYCAPSILDYAQSQSCDRKVGFRMGSLNARAYHNVYKSDVYSLGLCLLELQLTNVLPAHQLEQLFAVERHRIVGILNRLEQNLRETYLLRVDRKSKHAYKEYKIPNYLANMLSEEQSNRSYIFETCLATGILENLSRRFRIPFQKHFSAEVKTGQFSHRKRIVYPHANVEYEGEVRLQGPLANPPVYLRHGHGALNLEGRRVYQGQWSNNKAEGKCEIHFNELLVYEGEIKDGMLHGAGRLRFNDELIGTSRWYKNLQEDRTTSVTIRNILMDRSNPNINELKSIRQMPNVQRFLQHGIYLVVGADESNQPAKAVTTRKDTTRRAPHFRVSVSKCVPGQQDTTEDEFKVYFKNKYNQKCHYVFNLFHLRQRCVFLARWLADKLVASEDCLLSVNIAGRSDNSQLNSLPCEMLQISVQASPCAAAKHMVIVTNLDESVSFLCRFLKEVSYIHDGKPNLKYLSARGIPFVNMQVLQELLGICNSVGSLTLESCESIDDLCAKVALRKYSSWGKVKELDLSRTKITDRTVEELIRTNVLTALQTLSLNSCHRVSSLKLGQLLASEKISKLQRLEISEANFSNEVIQRAITANQMLSLRHLFLGKIQKVSDSLLAKFFNSPHLSNLQSLALKWSTVKDAAIEPIYKTCHFNLVQLDLQGCINVSNQMMWKILTSQRSRSLKVLNISSLGINDHLLVCWARHPFNVLLLSSLKMNECEKITERGANELILSRALSQTQQIGLRNTQIDDSTLAKLEESGNQLLRALDISKCRNITGDGLRRWAASKFFGRLRSLNASNTAAGSQFVAAITQARPSLKQLDISHCNRINAKSLNELVSSPAMQRLQRLNLEGLDFSPRTRQLLKDNSHAANNLIITRTSSIPLAKVSVLDARPNEFQSLLLIHSSKSLQDQSIQGLCKSGYLLKIHTLTVVESENSTMQYILSSGQLRNLHTLKFQFINVNTYLKALANNKAVSNLRNLSFMGCQFEDRSLLDLLRCPFGQSIQQANFTWTQMSSGILAAISQDRLIFNSLTALKLAKCSRINDKALSKFLNSSKVQKLVELDLRSTLITNLTIENMAHSKHLGGLKKLTLRACKNLRNSAFREFLNSKVAKSIDYLDISWTQLTGDLFRVMNESQHNFRVHTILAAGLIGIQKQLGKYLTGPNGLFVRVLDLSFTDITVHIFESLQNSSHLKHLTKFNVKGIPLLTLQEGWMLLSRNISVSYLGVSNYQNQFGNLLKVLLEHGKELEKIAVSNISEDEIKSWSSSLRTDKICADLDYDSES